MSRHEMICQVSVRRDVLLYSHSVGVASTRTCGPSDAMEATRHIWAGPCPGRALLGKEEMGFEEDGPSVHCTAMLLLFWLTSTFVGLMKSPSWDRLGRRAAPEAKKSKLSLRK